jgi:hypothetical protein
MENDCSKTLIGFALKLTEAKKNGRKKSKVIVLISFTFVLQNSQIAASTFFFLHRV